MALQKIYFCLRNRHNDHPAIQKRSDIGERVHLKLHFFF
jgi:hypothetical protein